MDMQAGGGVDPPATTDSQELTFDWLYQRVQGLVEHSIYPKAGRVETWAFRVGALAAAIGILGSQLPDRWLPLTAALVLVRVCLAVEIGGFVIGGFLAARRGLRQFVQPRLSHAQEMDGEFTQWQAVIAELRKFPRVERERRLKYVSHLRSSMIERMGLMYGGLQRLGPFPLLIALYLQFRQWRWGDWSSAFDVGALGAFIIYALVLLYLTGWLLIGLRSRLDTYVALLEGSIHEPEPSQPTSL
ncbi:hypothetical protein JY452_00090 [Stenotrophomonas maltophilia]|uniref:hypothetical protein n=1 Tax=Stenotrophomonas TaxID=40323 RepID=UPI0006C51900|nr:MULTISPECIES: hypothetical protein [Stenotrophomonas]KAA3602588.1 hypothetical protein D1178_05210 [Stenotrophomonas maltophilia]KOO79081.1 hypothetical protein VO93_11055 [Stenotrophomonas maltophilia]MBN5124402.1 hypothetical protein [Stenotrophomonas maltophilia]MBN5174947.1 hypothetical protein [Stenotrophomonas maltophilia]MBN7838138.1 hypothetical protein [Stenotrophomonas maltophilia]